MWKNQHSPSPSEPVIGAFSVLKLRRALKGRKCSKEEVIQKDVYSMERGVKLSLNSCWNKEQREDHHLHMHRHTGTQDAARTRVHTQYFF